MNREFKLVVSPLPGSDGKLYDITLYSRGKKKWNNTYSAGPIKRGDISRYIYAATENLMLQGGF